MASDALTLGGPRFVLPKQSCLRTAAERFEKCARLSKGPSLDVHLRSQCSRKGVSSVRADSRQDESAKGALPIATHAEGRRQVLLALAAAASAIAAHYGRANAAEGNAAEGNRKFTDMPAIRGKDYGKSAMRAGPDYILTETGLQYKELKPGLGPQAKKGQVAVVDWDGYTIGYLGRPFEARNKSRGGSFEGSEKDFYRFRLGDNKVIPAFEEAVAGMRVGSIRRIIVPPELGYPNNDYSKAGPQPQTFSGQRALDFVLKNQGLIDKTLLFDIELLKLED
ncbi:FKBP-type peptidyl-prolyl cis-trans isomerase family protein [Klebsormidium nitens]|uniref:peptidylprolyl isomerase n=1 Tax=Klebsormidium nitens TaxID=105231 RepID=A0A0U9HJA8_KLENI|nr:FKBP-type peptidyl-prolyl cis-trans isomerase family protein [Klebsormidium nitens]|eukprot:GAQ81998.1 FKBP-type peptidyl-prolyl cis-trans isomerase family protein [Klebsormidium nitens]